MRRALEQWLTAIGCAAMLAALSTVGGATAGGPVCPPEGGERHTVVRLTTEGLLVLDDGSEARAIGVLMPHPPQESEASAWPPFAETKVFLERELIGKTVRLVAEGRERDRHDVRLAHVAYPVENSEAWLAAELVGRGLARADPGLGLGHCVAKLLDLEQEARAAGKGLWQLPYYRLRDANDTAAMRSDALQFVVAEGVVRDVVRRAGETYLNFAERRTGFSALILERDRKAMEAAGLRVEGLGGIRVRLRGYVELREGPLIRIGRVTQIEALEAIEQRQAPAPSKRKRPAREAPDVQPRQ